MDEQKENIATTETVETGSTDNQVKVNQESAPVADKTFTQEDVDRIITNRLKQVERKFENINVEEYHQLKSAAEQAKEAEMMKKTNLKNYFRSRKQMLIHVLANYKLNYKLFM